MKSLTALLLLVPTVALAEPPKELEPMAFLAGHCWKGAFPDGKQTDEHCFTWMYGGKALRDVHTVRASGRPDYVGETTYYLDPTTHRVEFLYVENLGGVSRGTMQTEGNALVFPATQYAAEGESMTYRARWTRLDDTAYEAWSEAQAKEGWATLFRVTLKRVS